MEGLGSFFTTAVTTFFVLLIGEPIIKGLMRMFGFYAIVEEGTSHVYVLFGRVIGVLTEPGLYFLWFKLGPAALIVRWFGKLSVLDMRLDQKYLRSLPVNSEEGAPMGIGVWYEMFVSDPVAYLFKNTDPQGSLAANVSNATVRTLSNMPLREVSASARGIGWRRSARSARLRLTVRLNGLLEATRLCIRFRWRSGLAAARQACSR